MNALVITKFGDPGGADWDGLRWMAVSDPHPVPGNVMVRVEAAGLNFADILMARGGYPGTPPPPVIAGREFSGVMEETGEPVMGYTQWGAFAERFASPKNLLWPRPIRWSAEQGAAFPVNYFTAYLAFKVGGLLEPSTTRRRVLIHAVAGGVGTAAVQIGKILNLEMYGTSSSEEKLARLRELGLHHGINYKDHDFEQAIHELTAGAGVDAVLDMLGGDQTGKSQRCLADYGRVVLYGTVTGQAPHFDVRAMYGRTSSAHGLWLSMLAQKPEVMGPAWKQLSQWIEEGRLTPVIGSTVLIQEAAGAFRAMVNRNSFGKIVMKL